MKKVFITAELPQKAMKEFEQQFEIETWSKEQRPSEQDLIQKCENKDALVCMIGDPINKAFLKSSPHLQVIASYGVGFDHIDLITAAEMKIPISNTPDILTNSSAELGLAILFGLSRKINTSALDAKEGRWKSWSPTKWLGTDLKGKTLGIIGMGRIGQSFARKCALGLEMNVIYSSRSEKELNFPATRTDFNSVIADSDIISLHTSYSKETHHLLGKSEFKQMKNNALLVNTSRGAVINQDDLVWALETKEIAGAALDVTCPEPLPIDHQLFSMNNVLITPHIGSATVETRTDMGLMCLENIKAGLEGRALPQRISR